MVATIAETSTSNPTSEYWASPRQYLNKSESSSYTASGDLAIKSVFVNMAVSSAILNSQAGYRCTLVPRSMLQVLVTSLAFIPCGENASNRKTAYYYKQGALGSVTGFHL